MRPIGTTLLIAFLSLSGVAVAADALVTTEREELDGFLDDVTCDKPEARIEGALGYVNPSVASVKLSADGSLQEFAAGDSGQLADAVRGALGVFDSSDQDLLQHSVRVDGSHATVTTRMGDSGYEQTVIYDLVRKDERWLVRSMRVL
ncbi:MAG: hypothetical protein QM778_29605 [Myxococcales bacterium]